MTSMMHATQSVVLRMAGPGDALAVRQLADLDDAPPLRGAVMVALVDGEAVAALSLADDRVVANPFRFTEHTVALLRLRAGHLVSDAPRRTRRPFTLLR